MSVISSARALPCDLSDEKQTAYLLIPGPIMNSAPTPDKEGYDAPLLESCPAPVDNCPPGKNCEIRLHPLNLSPPPDCGIMDIPSTYYLPSLAFVVKNNVDASLNLLDPYLALQAIGSGEGGIVGGCVEDVECPGPDPITTTDNVLPEPTTVRNFLNADGILSAVYTISLYNSYQDASKKTIYEYVICPYAPTDIFKLPNPCALPPIPGVPDPFLPSEIMGTQPFCLGSKEHPCVCVSLLMHGGLEENPDPSLVGCTQTKLYWVGVKLYYTNIEGEMCHRNPVCLNITHAPDSAYMDCYTPYFAKTETVAEPVADDVVPPPCGQKSAGCPQPINVAPGESLHGKVYLGCGLDAEEEEPCKTGPNLIHVAKSVDLSDFIHDPCSVYVVLIPKVLETLAE